MSDVIEFVKAGVVRKNSIELPKLLESYITKNGWALVPIARGQKGPRVVGWNKRENCISAPEQVQSLGGNVGIAHAYCDPPTAALDIDRLDGARGYLCEHGIDLDTLLCAPDSVGISSGRPNRAKLLYTLPEPLASLKLADGAFELRCATRDCSTVQDLIPPSRHPEGQPYRWILGSDVNGTKPPTIPGELLALWRSKLPTVIESPPSSVVPSHEITGLRELIAGRDPDASYDDWLRVGMALHHETCGSNSGLAVWNEWSASGKKYKGLADLETHWRSFRNDVSNPVTRRSLVRDAVVQADASPMVPAGTTSDAAERPALAFKCNKSGRALATIENVATALRVPEWCRFHLAFDAFRDEVMVAAYGTEDWQPLGDEGTTKIMEEFERAGFAPIAREVMRNTLSMVAGERKFDSAILWLEGLKWDGTSRVERFLPDYCAAEDSPYTRAVSLYLWTALAGRLLVPGCKADMVPILVGRQGAKKTSGVAALVPSPDFFTEVNLMERDEDLSRKLRGRLVGEIGELRGLSTRDLESIKTFITRTHEDWIPKYREFAVRFPRRLVFIGTTNSAEFLADETGHRRWLPVEVGVIDVGRIKADRLQLWAEGAVLWKASGIAWREAEERAPAMHKKHVVSDSWEMLINRWLDDADAFESEPRRARPFVTSDLMAGALSMSASQMTRANTMRLAKVLRFMGFEPRITKSKGKSVRVWAQA